MILLMLFLILASIIGLGSAIVWVVLSILAIVCILFTISVILRVLED